VVVDSKVVRKRYLWIVTQRFSVSCPGVFHAYIHYIFLSFFLAFLDSFFLLSLMLSFFGQVPLTCTVSKCDDSILCETWLIRVRDMTHSWVQRDSSMCVTRRFHVCAKTHSCGIRLIHMCDVTHSCAWHPHIHDVFMRATWHLFVPTTWKIHSRMTRLIHVCGMTHS